MLDQLYLAALGEGCSPSDIEGYEVLADAVNKWRSGWHQLYQSGLIRAEMVDDDETGDYYYVVSLTNEGLGLAERSLYTEVASKDRDEKLTVRQVESSRDEYANNPMWGIL
jgi:hypothetical protein